MLRMPLSLLGLLFLVSIAFGQEAPDPPTQEVNPADLAIEDLYSLKVDSVFAASKHDQNTLEAPSSVTIITADEIRRYGYRTVADVMRHVRGFFVNYDRNYTYVGTRGFGRPGDYSSRFLQLIDGHRSNENIYDSSESGTDFPLDLDLIERIEIIRGPASSLYGTSAFFAVFNIITKKGKDLDGPLLSTSGGSLGTNLTHVAWGQRFGRKSDYLISVSQYFSKGYERLHYPEFDTAEGPGIAVDQDEDRRRSFFAQATLGNFAIQTLYASRTKHIPTGSYETVFNDSRNTTRDWHGYFDATYQKDLSHAWKLDSRGYYERYGYDGMSVYANEAENGDEFTSLNKDVARGQWFGQETRLSKNWKDRHHTIVGSEFRRNLKQDQMNLDLEPQMVVYLDQPNQSTTWALFAQEEVKLTKRFALSVGIRFDHYSTFGGSTNPRAALIFNPDATSAIKLLYGQAFRAPNVYELFWHQAYFGIGNTRLSPESIRTAEIVYEKTLLHRWVISTQVFRNSIRDLITQRTDIDAEAGFVNFGRIRATGWEAEIARKIPDGFEIQGSYALQFSRDQETGERLSNSPRHIFQMKIGNAWFRQRLWTGVDAYAITSRFTSRGTTAAGYIVPNITVGTNKPVHGFDLSATIYNATDALYADPGSTEHRQDAITQDGRTFRIKASFQLPADR